MIITPLYNLREYKAREMIRADFVNDIVAAMMLNKPRLTTPGEAENIIQTQICPEYTGLGFEVEWKVKYHFVNNAVKSFDFLIYVPETPKPIAGMKFAL